MPPGAAGSPPDRQAGGDEAPPPAPPLDSATRLIRSERSKGEARPPQVRVEAGVAADTRNALRGGAAPFPRLARGAADDERSGGYFAPADEAPDSAETASLERETRTWATQP